MTEKQDGRVRSGRRRLYGAMLSPTPIRDEVDAAISEIAARPDIGSKAEAVRLLLDWGLWCDASMVKISGEGVAPLGEAGVSNKMVGAALQVTSAVDRTELRRLLREASEALRAHEAAGEAGFGTYGDLCARIEKVAALLAGATG